MKTIALTATPTNDLILPPNIVKRSFSQTESTEHSTVRDRASEKDIWKQLEPIYSWVGI